MYEVLLAIHNIARWVVLLLGFVVVIRAFVGWLGRQQWSETERRIGLFFAIGLDIQLLLGLVLYFLFSPFTRFALQNCGEAMGLREFRFFAVEHSLLMVLAVVFAHLGSSLSKKAPQDTSKYRRAAIWFTLALLMIMLGMPWWRPLFPGLG
jgi:hypothetical protein